MNEKNCPHPWLGLNIIEDGDHMRPCCKYESHLDPLFEKLSLNEGNTIEDFKNSAFMKNLRQQFLQDNDAPGCKRCWEDEKAGYKSKRQIDLEKFSEQIKEIKLENNHLKFISIPLGNLCNLKCRICGPEWSTSWFKEHKDIYGTDFKIKNWYKNSKVWHSLLKNLENSIEIHIHGGEPFLTEVTEHKEMLEHIIRNGQANKISIHYSTNGTVYPSDDFWSLWKHFKNVDIQPSIDDGWQRFEYNRYPAKWEEVEYNLIKYRNQAKKQSNIQYSIATCVSAYTIFYLEDFFDWIYKKGLPKPYLGRVERPKYMDCAIFPEPVKEKIREKIMSSKHADIRSTLSWIDNPSDSTLYKQFVEANAVHDRYRNMFFRDVFSELNEILGKFG